jgi:hypothetical protein
MPDPFRGPPGTNPPRYPAERNFNKAAWIAGGVAVAIGLALVFAVGRPGNPTTAANPPAVVAAPAPAAGVPAPAPEDTTGRAAPRAQ